MKIQILLAFVLMQFCFKTNAQSIVNRQFVAGGTSDDYLSGVCLSNDGSLAAAGYSNSNKSLYKTENSQGDYDYWIIKTTRNKTTGKWVKEWDKTIGGSAGDVLIAALSTKDGGYLLAGNSLSGISGEKTEPNKGANDVWLVKLNVAGSISWQRSIGNAENNYLKAIDKTNNAGYVILYDSSLLILDNDGNTRNQILLSEEYVSVEQTNDEGYILANNIKGSLTKLDAKGVVIWSKIYGVTAGPYGSRHHGAQQMKDGGYIFYGLGAGSYSESGDYYYDWQRILVKTDANGNLLWKTDANQYYDYNYSSGITLAQVKDGGFLVGTSFGTSFPNYNCEKFDGNGNFIWSKLISGDRTDMLRDIKEVGNGKYIIAGYSNSNKSLDKELADIDGFDFWITGVIDTASVAVANTLHTKLAENIAINKAAQVYPNPVKNILYINAKGKNIFELKNLQGKIIAEKVIENTGYIDVAFLPVGIYYLKNITTSKTTKVVLIK